MSTQVTTTRVPSDLAELLELIPAVFHRLSAATSLLHGDEGLTAGKRGVLISLARQGPTSVAALAHQRPVSRQFMHRLIDEMTTEGWVETRTNPDHKRSPLVALSRQGSSAVAKIVEVELEALTRLANAFSGPEVEAALGVLRTLATLLSSQGALTSPVDHDATSNG